MTSARSGSSVPYVLALIWLVFTVSLASWWLSVGLTLTNRHRMFMWEGATFIVMLVAGGVTIVLAIRREHRRRQAVETFFMSFTHDLKTSISSLQLQAEGLREDWPGAAPREPLDRLLQETVRLQIQLENSLFVAQPDGRLLRERIDAAAAIARLAQDWPDLRVGLTGAEPVLADARAFDAVVRNLLQNSAVHGGATQVEVAIDRAEDHRVRLTFADNGRGVSPEAISRLGQLFARVGETSGTGVGLFVCGRLVSRMGGRLSFRAPPDGRGLVVVIDLPEVAS
jgi:signal transduction histidine kinase